MRGPEKICCAVRRPDGTIDLSYSDVTTHWYNKVPLVRGVCNMVENLMNGYKYLMHSADIAMTEEEKEEEKQNESKLDRWLDEHAGPKVQSALTPEASFLFKGETLHSFRPFLTAKAYLRRARATIGFCF